MEILTSWSAAVILILLKAEYLTYSFALLMSSQKAKILLNHKELGQWKEVMEILREWHIVSEFVAA